MPRVIARLVALWLMATMTLSAQTTTTFSTVQPGAMQQPGQPGQPINANAPVAQGTATLRGHVFAGDTGQALRKAQVRIAAPDIRENRMATTDANGSYEFKAVRAGRYTVSASKGNYVRISYGQQRSTDAGKPLVILDNQVVERVDLTLPAGGVITGRILDEYGEPVPEVQVAIQRLQIIQGQRRLVPSGRTVTTNDIGEFRLFAIPPGQYYVSATWRNAAMMFPGGSPADRTAYAPVYFPGTTNVSEAQRLTLAAGQRLDDVVMALKPVRATRVTGTAFGSDGRPMTPGMIVVSQSTGFGVSSTGGGQVRPDGTFTVGGLAPGEYTLRVQRMGSPGEWPEMAMTTITATGEDIADVHLVAAKPSTLSGRVIVDPAAASSLPPTLMVAATPAIRLSVSAPPPPPARVADDYTFEMKAPPGRMRITIGGGINTPAAGWTVRAVRLTGVDVTDAGIEIRANEDISGIEVELTNRLTTISGLVTNSRGEASRDYTAIVFAQDSEKWTGNSRYRGAGRPDQDGRFKIAGLPPGEYYIIAVDRLEPGQQGDPEFLESVRSRATSLSLTEGESKTVDLRLSAGP